MTEAAAPGFPSSVRRGSGCRCTSSYSTQGTGWHTDDLCRALAERGHTARVLPYEGLVARLGTGRGLSARLSGQTGEKSSTPMPCSRGSFRRIARTDDLPRRCAALD